MTQPIWAIPRPLLSFASPASDFPTASKTQLDVELGHVVADETALALRHQRPDRQVRRQQAFLLQFPEKKLDLSMFHRTI